MSFVNEYGHENHLDWGSEGRIFYINSIVYEDDVISSDHSGIIGLGLPGYSDKNSLFNSEFVMDQIKYAMISYNITLNEDSFDSIEDSYV